MILADFGIFLENGLSITGAVISVVVALGGSFFAGVVFYGSRRKVRLWDTASGTVLGYSETLRDKQSIYRPQIQFVTKQGKSISFDASIASSRKPYRIGDNIEVIYPADSPAQATVKSFGNLYGFSIGLWVIAAVFLGISIHLITQIHSSH